MVGPRSAADARPSIREARLVALATAPKGPWIVREGRRYRVAGTGPDAGASGRDEPLYVHLLEFEGRDD